MNPYAILQVEPGAPFDQITRAYRSLAKRWHPDLFQDKHAALASERMSAINAAYDQLRRQGRAQPAKGRPSAPAASAKNRRRRRTRQTAFHHVFRTRTAPAPERWWDLPGLLVVLQTLVLAACTITGLWSTWTAWMALLLPGQILALVLLLSIAPEEARTLRRPGRQSWLRPAIVSASCAVMALHGGLILLAPFFVLTYKYVEHLGI